MGDGTGALTLGQSYEPFGDKLSSTGSTTLSYAATGSMTGSEVCCWGFCQIVELSTLPPFGVASIVVE
ncbi:MAG: hypothetical protein IIC79_05865 [Chloroflexi bacterium]|nr:hypothetical protein [Chloroflexota bacterium]